MKISFFTFIFLYSTLCYSAELTFRTKENVILTNADCISSKESSTKKASCQGYWKRYLVPNPVSCWIVAGGKAATKYGRTSISEWEAIGGRWRISGSVEFPKGMILKAGYFHNTKARIRMKYDCSTMGSARSSWFRHGDCIQSGPTVGRELGEILDYKLALHPENDLGSNSTDLIFIQCELPAEYIVFDEDKFLREVLPSLPLELVY